LSISKWNTNAFTFYLIIGDPNMKQAQIVQWARKVLTNSWLYKTNTGELVLPVDVKDDWAFICTNTDEILVPSLLFTTAKKVVYRVTFSTGTVDISIPMNKIQLVSYPS
jgi:hypothetical protein